MREEHRCAAMRKSNTGRRRGNDVYEYGVVTMAAVIVVFQLCLNYTSAAPAAYDSLLPQSGEIAEYFSNNEYISGCYYNFQRYEEGDRIVTNEPCLNCTCHNRMLMCYLRVCPFTKAIGQDCTIEKKPDQCCPIITCPEVPVKLLTSSTTSSPTPTTHTTEIGFHDNYGCSINDSFYADGAQVPSDPRKPCELCYCIRNRTACVMQECTLHVEGCKPVYQDGVCCPVRYDCDYEKEIMSTPRLQTSGGVIKSTTYASVVDCQYGNQSYSDGELITTDKPCEHCYCMRGDIVCAVQDCGEPLRGKDCVPTMPPPEQCCPSSYDCTNDTSSTTENITKDPNIFNTEVTTTFEKSTPLIHASSILTPDEIYTKLGENKSPASTNFSKPDITATIHPSEGIQMDSNNVDVGEHFTTTITNIPTNSGIQESSSVYHTSSSAEQLTTIGNINPISFENKPSIVEAQTPSAGDIPTTILLDFSSTGTNEVSRSTTTAKQSEELYVAISTSSENSLGNTQGYTKISETTKYVSNNIVEQATEIVSLTPENPTESHPSGNEISDNGQVTSTPNRIEQKLPEDAFVKVPSDLSLGMSTEVNEYSTNSIHKTDSTTQNILTDTKNTISDKNTQPISDTGVDQHTLSDKDTHLESENELGQPTQNAIQNSFNGVHELPNQTTIADNSEAEEPIQATTHYADLSSVGTKEPTQSTASPLPGSVDFDTESLSGFPSHYPIHETTHGDISSSQQPSLTTAFPEVSMHDQPLQTTVNNLISDSIYSTTISSLDSVDVDHISNALPSQTTLHYSSDRVSILESHNNVNQPASVGNDAYIHVEMTVNPVASMTQDLPVPIQTQKPAQEVIADRFNNSVSYTKQPTVESTHYTVPSVDETTFTYSSPTNVASISPEIVESSTSFPQSTLDGSAVIPGEGSCLVDGITYSNETIIESSNPCHSKCICLSSIPTCTLISCSPPPSDPKCMPVQIKPESCCPVYVCNGGDTPAAVPSIPSDSHIIQNDIETAPTTSLLDLITSSKQAPTQFESEENSIDSHAKPTSILPSSSSSELPSTSASTHAPVSIISNKTPVSISHDTSQDSAYDSSHDENEISNEVPSGTESPVIQSSDSQLKNASHVTPLFDNVNFTVKPAYSTTNRAGTYESMATSTETIEYNSSSTSTNSATPSSQQVYSQSVTQGQIATEYPSETVTPSEETSESNEISASTEYEKYATTSQTQFPTGEIPAVSTSSSLEFDTTIQPNEMPDHTSITTLSPISSSEYYKIKLTTNEPYHSIHTEVTHSPSTKPSYNINSSPSESVTVIDNSNDVITAHPQPPIAPSSGEQSVEGSSSTYETTIKVEYENLSTELTNSGLPDHSEVVGLPTTITNEVSPTEVPIEESSSAIDTKFQEKFSTTIPLTETKGYQSVITGSAISASLSNEVTSESSTGSYETTIVMEEITSTKSEENLNYSTPTSIGSSTLIDYSTTLISQATVTENKVTEINTQLASVPGSSEITPVAEYIDTKMTLAPVLLEGSTDNINPISAPISEIGPILSNQPLSSAVITTTSEEAPTTISTSQNNLWSNVPEKVASLLNHTTIEPLSSTTVTYPPIQHSTWTRKPVDEEVTSEASHYPQPPIYPPGIENSNTDGLDYPEGPEGDFGPGTCRYAGKVYVSAQQIPRDDPCDFCFCFRSDIICLQQSCPPPIHGCRQEPIEGFCCPRYECPVTTYGLHNTSTTITTTTTTTTTTAPSRPPRFPYDSYRNAARRTGCVIHGYFYDVGDEIAIASGPCLECLCGSDGRMKCDPKLCSPEPNVRQALAESE